MLKMKQTEFYIAAKGLVSAAKNLEASLDAELRVSGNLNVTQFFPLNLK